jgi:hypothetical protein
VPDYFRCHASECTQITPEPLILRVADLASARQPPGAVTDEHICGTEIADGHFAQLRGHWARLVAGGGQITTRARSSSDTPACPPNVLPTPLSRSPEDTASSPRFHRLLVASLELCLITTALNRIIEGSRADTGQCVALGPLTRQLAFADVMTNSGTSCAPITDFVKPHQPPLVAVASFKQAASPSA